MAEAGRRIGPYRLLSVLGRGAMGEVWKARDERLDRLVALKLLPRDQKSNAERRVRMLREAKAAASILHNNVVTLYDIVSDEGDDVLVMELVEGETLADLVGESGALGVGEALSVLISLCEALVAAHDKGILHRDVKTANVMRAKDGAIKVLDFGLAKLRETIASADAPVGEVVKPIDVASSPEEIALDQTLTSIDGRELGDSSADELLMTRAGQILGTPLYMAPEQFAGEAPTIRSEVFAVGVVGYELLSGAPPFVGSTYEELQEQVFKEEPKALDVPKDVSAAIVRALEKDPEKRFGTMSELLDELVAIRNRMTRPRRLAWIAMAAAVFLGLVGVAVAVGMNRGSKSTAKEQTPGDRYVAQALEEHNLFYNQKAAASIRAAIREEPDHPVAYAYAILFPTEEGAELDRMLREAKRVSAKSDLGARESALLVAAIALAERGPGAAREVLLEKAPNGDGELRFWQAELAYRARDYETARAELAEALESSDPSFAGRIYDHYSAVLSFLGEKEEAAKIGRLYADAFAGEPDAIGVYATTLAGVGKLDEALAAAKEALRLYRGEDTIAGLAKVHALRGEYDEARKLYKTSAAMASDSRRPIRNAAYAYLSWIVGDDTAARAAVADCLPGGADDHIWQRAQCLWVAGTIWPEKTAIAIEELERLARAGTPLRPAYGNPTNLANYLRARQIHFAGACHRTPKAPAPNPDPPTHARLLTNTGDFYASYHIPHFSDYARCELR